MPDMINLDYFMLLYCEFQKYVVRTMSVVGGEPKRHANTSYIATTHTFLISDYYEFNYSLCCGLRLRGSSCSIKKLYWSYDHVFLTVNEPRCQLSHHPRWRGRNRIRRREKRSKKSWEEGEIGGKSREEGENVS